MTKENVLMILCEVVRAKILDSQSVAPNLTDQEADHMTECVTCAEIYEHFLFSGHSQEMFEAQFDKYLNSYLHHSEAAFDVCVPEQFRCQIREAARTRFIN